MNLPSPAPIARMPTLGDAFWDFLCVASITEAEYPKKFCYKNTDDNRKWYTQVMENSFTDLLTKKTPLKRISLRCWHFILSKHTMLSWLEATKQVILLTLETGSKISPDICFCMTTAKQCAVFTPFTYCVLLKVNSCFFFITWMKFHDKGLGSMKCVMMSKHSVVVGKPNLPPYHSFINITTAMSWSLYTNLKLWCHHWQLSVSQLSKKRLPAVGNLIK